MKHLALTALAAPLLFACEPAGPTYITTGSDAPMITVSESANVSVSPDQASVSAGVVAQAPDAGAAMSLNREKMVKVFAELEKAGIKKENISTSQLTLQPRYDYRNGQNRITGYEARNVVTVKTDDLDQVGPMLDALVAAGVNNIDNVSFDIKDPSAARAEARTKAIKAARTKAEEMADAAGVKLGDLKSLSESGGARPQPVYYARVEAQSMDASTPIAAGDQTLSVTVNMVYEIDQ